MIYSIMPKKDELFPWSMNTMFEQLFKDTKTSLDVGRAAKVSTESRTFEAYRCTTDDKGMELEVDLPGVRSDQIEAWSERNVLSVTGKSPSGKTFTNRYTVDDKYDTLTSKASMAHGQLKIRILLRPESQTKPVRINIEYT